MSLPVEFLAGAHAELQEALNRFEELRDDLGTEFLVAVEAYLTRLTVFSEIAPTYLERIRRQVVRKFPCGIFYELYPTRLLAIAILDLRRDEQQIIRCLRC